MAKFSRARIARARTARAGGGEGQLGQLAAAASPCRGTSLIAVARLSPEKWRACAKEGNALDDNIHNYQFVTAVTAKPSFICPSPQTSDRLALGLRAQRVDLGFRGEKPTISLPLGALLFER
jgi:hypothetical protein